MATQKKLAKKTVKPASTAVKSRENKPTATTKASVLKAKKAQKPEKATRLSAAVVGVDGGNVGRTTLPDALFGVSVNKTLLAQAVRVYRANQREGSAHTKTRGEVKGSTRKIYKQKGTGRARHGNIRAPIFVGGGIVFGPRTRDFRRTMSKKMKRAALASALTEKYSEKSIIVVEGFESLEPKTKKLKAALLAIGVKGSALLAIEKGASTVVRISRNLTGVDTLRAIDLHPFAILTHKNLVITKKALEEMKKHFKA